MKLERDDNRVTSLAPLVQHFRRLKREQRVNEYSVQSIAKKAKENKLWFFIAHNKTWLNPEEFASLYERIKDAEAMVQNMQLRDPFEGVEAAYKQMESLQNRAKAFTKRVLDYYH